MIRAEVVRLAKSLNWKPWGKLRKYGDSSYQCFRRGNEYLWIGLRYIERTSEPLAVDFVAEPSKVSNMLLWR